MRNFRFFFKTPLLMFCFFGLAGANEDDKSLDQMNLEDLMNIKIVTASKKEENFFETPLSACVLTKEEIKNSGIVSLQELFRLIPGFIVRQQTNGNFDIHLRGLNSVPENQYLNFATNSTTLVMIDNRVVYSYFQGATLWETLPIGLDDIERIEIIRGPASALYGPNAVSGVIHFITRRPKKDGISTWTSVATGTPHTQVGGASVSFRGGEEWNATLNINASRRSRLSLNYFDFNQSKYVNSPSELVGTTGLPAFTDYSRIFPDPFLSLRQAGVNSFLTFQPSEKIRLDLEVGYQVSRSQNARSENNYTPLSTHDSSTRYVDFKTKADAFNFHFASLNGVQNQRSFFQYQLTNTIYPGGSGPNPSITVPYFTGMPTYSDELVFDMGSRFTTLDEELEYVADFGNFTLRPALSARQAYYDGKYIGGSQALSNYALSLRSDYRLDAWLFAGAIRLDKYNYPKKPYTSWQFAMTRSLGENHVLRAVYSRAYQAPSMAGTFLDIQVTSPAPISGVTGTYAATSVHAKGNKNPNLMQWDLYELGYRTQFTETLSLDNDLFFQVANHLQGFSINAQNPALVVQSLTDLGGAQQLGWTTSLIYTPTQELHNRFFFTLQQTHITTNNTLQKHFETPLLFGGFVTNYKPWDQLNINLNTYFMSAHQFSTYNLRRPSVEIASKFLVNLKVAYFFNPSFSVYAAANNLLNNQSKEFGLTDDTGGVYFGGLSLDL